MLETLVQAAKTIRDRPEKEREREREVVKRVNNLGLSHAEEYSNDDGLKT